MAQHYAFDLERAVFNNENSKHRVLLRTTQQELTSMTLRPGETIPKESHTVAQFIYVLFGQGQASVADKVYDLKPGAAILVPAGIEHELRNNSRGALKMFSIYSPPQDE